MRQAKQHEAVCGVLGQSAVTRLFRNAYTSWTKGDEMFDLGPDARARNFMNQWSAQRVDPAKISVQR